jgi:hypothetical protein
MLVVLDFFLRFGRPTRPLCFGIRKIERKTSQDFEKRFPKTQQQGRGLLYCLLSISNIEDKARERLSLRRKISATVLD